MEHNIPELVAQLTLEEKAGLCSGADFWHTKTVERLGIPTLMVFKDGRLVDSTVGVQPKPAILRMLE